MVRTQPAPTSVEYVLLGLLFQQPCHGYELHKQLANLDGIGLLWRVKQANLYALLDKLERKGWVRSQTVQDEQRQARKQYTLSDAGRWSWLAWARSPVRRGRDMRQEFLSKLYFARRLGGEQARALLRSQRDECCLWLQEFNQLLNGSGPDQAFERDVYRFRLHQVQAMLDWLDGLIADTGGNSRIP